MNQKKIFTSWALFYFVFLTQTASVPEAMFHFNNRESEMSNTTSDIAIIYHSIRKYEYVDIIYTASKTCII